MPRHQYAELVRRMQRRYGFDPPFVPDTIAPEIVGVTIVDSVLEHVADDRKAFVGVFQTAHVAEKSYAQITNPGGSGVIVTVDQVWVTIGRLTGWHVGTYTGILPSSDYPEIWRDRRQAGRPVALVRRGNGTPTFQAYSEHPRVINELDKLDLGWVLPPGQNVGVASNAINCALFVTFLWTERAVRELED